jgi:ABC-type multidrug transport system ATPase subunit
MWKIIEETKKERCTILTSHAMEEVEYLCNRIAMMFSGQISCIGSPRHLKTKLGQGMCVLEAVASEEKSEENVRDGLLALFPGSKLFEEHSNRIKLLVPLSKDLSLSRLLT